MGSGVIATVGVTGTVGAGDGYGVIVGASVTSTWAARLFKRRSCTSVADGSVLVTTQ